MSLTPKQQRFVEAYLVDPNGKRAAIKAGYAAGSAAIAAARLLTHAGVAEELSRRRKVVETRAGVTPEMVVAELAKIGFADIRQVVEWQTRQSGDVLYNEAGEPVDVAHTSVTIKDAADLADAPAAAIAEISQTKDGTLKIKMHDKLGALVKIGQHLGMFRPVGAPEEPGKKEVAEQRAKTAQQGTGWDGLLQ